jgi:hypothetical protein
MALNVLFHTLLGFCIKVILTSLNLVGEHSVYVMFFSYRFSVPSVAFCHYFKPLELLQKPGVMAHTCNSTLGRPRQEDLEFEASMGYVVEALPQQQKSSCSSCCTRSEKWKPPKMKLPTAEKLLMSLIEQCLICAALLDLWI